MSARRVAVLVGIASIACGQLLGLGDDDEPRPDVPTKAADAGDATADDVTTVPVGSVDGGVDAAADSAADAARRPRVVFVTRKTMTGAFGGLDAGDALCNAEALDAGLGTGFVAWLSLASGITLVDAKSRLSGDAGWSLVDGGEVFAGPSAIVAGSYPKVGIATTAWGETVDGKVWTATRETGARYEGSDCNAWTSEGLTAVDGVVGATDLTWTVVAADSCGLLNRLICFEK